MKINDSTPFVLVTYHTDKLMVTCAILGRPSTLSAVRKARAKMRSNGLRPLKLLGLERIG